MSANPAFAQSFRLAYSAADECPEEESFRDLVLARGGGSFDPNASIELRVDIERIEHGFIASVTSRDANGHSLGAREIRGGNCDALAETCAMTVSLIMEEAESNALTPEPSTHATGPSESQRAAPIDDERPPSMTSESPPDSELWARLGVSAGVGFGPAPLPHTVMGLLGGFRFSEFAMTLLLQYADTFASGSIGDRYGLRVRFLRARAAPCLVAAPMEFCLAASVGYLEGEPSGVRDAQMAHALIGTLGGIVGVTWMFDPRFGLQVSGEISLMLDRLSFLVGGESVWSAWPVFLELNVSFLAEL